MNAIEFDDIETDDYYAQWEADLQEREEYLLQAEADSEPTTEETKNET